MNATSIYDLLQAKGLTLGIAGDKIRISPPELVNDEIKALIQEHKDDLIKEIRRRVEMITLDELPDTALAIKVYSRVLGEDIYICSDVAMKKQVEGEGLVVYLPRELKVIHQNRLKPEDIIECHRFKKEFDGAITSTKPKRHRAGKTS